MNRKEMKLLRNVQGAVHMLRKAIHASDPWQELDFRCHDIWTDLEKLAALRASAAPEEGMNHRTTAEPNLGSGHRSAEDAASYEAVVAREVVTEWLGMFDPPPQIDFQQSEMLQGAIAFVVKAARPCECAARPDAGSVFEATSTVVDHQSDNSGPQEAVVNTALAPATEDGASDPSGKTE